MKEAKIIVYDDFEWLRSGATVTLERKSFFWADRFNIGSFVMGVFVGVFIAFGIVIFT